MVTWNKIAIETLTPTQLIVYLQTLDLNDTHLSSYSDPSDPLETGLGPPSDYSFGQPF